MVTKKWKQEFRLLETMGAFVVGDSGDTFSLIAVYSSVLESDLTAHYEAMRDRIKKKSTINPEYPSGTWRRSELYRSFESHLTPLTVPEIEEIRQVGHASTPDEAISDHQIDPLSAQVDRDGRSSVLENLRPLELAEEYAAHRSYTKFLESRGIPSPQERAEAALEAAAGVAEFRRRLASASW
jgi:hypothetical protein